jgi:hypothetical protein
MIWTFRGALVMAGIFTFMPGRIMHRMVFGQPFSSTFRTKFQHIEKTPENWAGKGPFGLAKTPESPI